MDTGGQDATAFRELNTLFSRVRVRVPARAQEREGWGISCDLPVADEICAGRQGEGETEPKQIETRQGIALYRI